jgi:hypothetical protein
MSLWYAVVRDGAVLHFGQDRPVAAFQFTQHEGSGLFTVQSLSELDSIIKPKSKNMTSEVPFISPGVSAQNVDGGCCGGKPCGAPVEEDPIEELRKGFNEGVQIVKETSLDLLRKVGVSEDDLNEFAGKVKAGVDEIGTNIKAGGEKAVENTKSLGKTVGGWFTAIGEKLSK